MGASAVSTIIVGNTAREAYSKAVEEARYEYGSGGYTGSIAESQGCFMYQPQPLLAWEAQYVADRLIATDKVTKWGPTALIPMAPATAVRTIITTIDTTGLDYDGQDAAVYNAVKAKMRVGESIEAVGITTEKKHKIEVTTPEGEPKTVFIVKGHGTSKAYRTLTEAKQAAKTALATRGDTYTITKTVMKGESEAFAVVSRKTVKSMTVVTATVGKPKMVPVTKWMTAGWYSD